jgi:hypothetical protein
MRKLLLIAAILIALVAGVAIYLAVTTPRSARGVRFPLDDNERALLACVPDAAESFALVPTAAALDAKLRVNPLTRDVLDRWEQSHSLPQPWMIGSADLIAWRSGQSEGPSTRYLVRVDAVRAAVIRLYMMLGGDIGETLTINPAPVQRPDAPELAQIVALSARLPPGDALVVQRRGSRGAFPPMARPAVTSVAISTDDIVLTSRAARDATQPVAAQSSTPARFPRGALLSAAFTTMPRAVEDLNRLFGTRVSQLLENGGEIVVYDIDARKLLPRPSGVIAVPADPQRRAAFDEFVARVKQGELLGIHIRTAEAGGMLLLSFDDSMDLYLKDVQEPGRWPAGKWTLRADPRRLAPILDKLGDSIGLRIASPHIFRSARDMSRWIGSLQQATSIEAAASGDATADELKVRIATK